MAHLVISAQDNQSTIHSVFLKNDPKHFVGKPDEKGYIRKWGLPAVDPQYFNSPGMCLRIINYEGCYQPGSFPILYSPVPN